MKKAVYSIQHFRKYLIVVAKNMLRDNWYKEKRHERYANEFKLINDDYDNIDEVMDSDFQDGRNDVNA